ncbi:kinase-like domain-containing protein [Biscogniauxia sp. FL1348]|nr:kinase-like domain-containing protein [Biscogniauxia sp. FL1348]
MAHVSAREYLDSRKWETHYFKEYRRSLKTIRKEDNDWILEELPRKGFKPGPWTSVSRDGQSLEHWDLDPANNDMNLSTKPQNMSPRASLAWDRLQEAKLYFGSIPNVEYKSCLGRGGQGIVILCAYKNPDTGVVRQFVVKMSIAGWFSEQLRAEESLMGRLDRAEHIVQLIPREEVGLPPPPPTRPLFSHGNPYDSEDDDWESSGSASPDSDVPIILPVPRSAFSQETKQDRRTQWVDRETRKYRDWTTFMIQEQSKGFQGHRDYLVLEYFRNGPLLNLIQFNRQSNLHTPNRVLWSFWLCLIRACIGLEFWPSKFHPDRHRPVAPGASRHLKEELPHPNRRWRRKRLVHFDIDPLNILIGDVEPDDPEHSLIPKLKVSDLGLGQEVYASKRDVYYHSMRKNAKANFYAPEQFTNEWDGFGVDPDDDGISRYITTSSPVGANYDVASNIWGIASSMSYLIMGNLPPRPPHPKRRKLRAGMLQMDATLWTYGDMLLDEAYNYVDRDLINILVRCLAHNPRQRPGLDELLDVAQRGRQKMFPGEADEAIRHYFTTAGVLLSSTGAVNPAAGHVPDPGASSSFTWSQFAIPVKHSIRDTYEHTFRNSYNIYVVNYNDADHGYIALRDSLLMQLDQSMNIPSVDVLKDLGAAAMTKYTQFAATQPGRVIPERLGAVTYDWAISQNYNVQLGLRFTDKSLRVITTPITNHDTVTVWIRVQTQERETKDGMNVFVDCYNCMIPKPDPVAS